MITLAIATLFIGVLTLALGITLSDFKHIRTEQAYRRAPHARRWRKRPAIFLDPSDTQSLANLRKSYRNISSNKASDWRVHIPQHLSINPRELQHAVRQLQNDPLQRYVPLSARIGSFSNLRQLLSTYRTVLSAQSATVRHGLHVMPVDNHPYLEIHSVPTHPLSTLAYELASILMVFTVNIVFIAAFSLALLVQQADLLIGFVSAFLLFAIWSIGRVRYLSFWRKLVLVALLPTAFVYLYCLLVSMPARTATRLGRPLGAIIRT